MSKIFLETAVKNKPSDTLHVQAATKTEDTLSTLRFQSKTSQNEGVAWSRSTQQTEFNLRSQQVISNRLLPYKFNPVPFSNQADAVYVVNVANNLGFSASRLSKQDTREVRLQEIRNIWNQNTINQVWTAAVSAQLLEEEFFYAMGFFLSVRKIAVKDLKNKLKQDLPSNTKEVWDITVWDHNNGAIRAVHQYITTREPEPAIFKKPDGEDVIIYLLSEEEAIIPDLQTGTFELFNLRTSSGKVVKRLHKKNKAQSMALAA